MREFVAHQRSHPDAKGAAGPVRQPRGASLVEVQVAFVVLGIGLMGLCQAVVIQFRQIRVMEKRLQGQVVQTTASNGTSTTMLTGNTYYLVPWQSPLTRKLSGEAQIANSPAIACDPGPLTAPPLSISYPITITELDASAGGQNVTAYVDVSAPSAGS
jgi:hypothetical protein